MPTIEVDSLDLQALLGIELPKDPEKLDDLLSYVKGEVKSQTEQELSIEIKDSNRADVWSVEGLARALRGYLSIEKGLKSYTAADGPSVKVKVSPKLKSIRPLIGCAVIRDVKLNDTIIRAAMSLQGKLDQTYGRNRRRASIGLYNYDLISPPLNYHVAKPDEASFVPLDFHEKMTLKQILEKHPKGLEYGHLVKQYPVWPLLSDSNGQVLSFPPIINSNDLGKITEATRNVLIEVTGTSHETVLNTLNMVIVSLADRGGRIHSAEIQYSHEGKKRVVTPQLETTNLRVDLESISRVLGFRLAAEELPELLEKARYGVSKLQKSALTVVVPCYRIDIMHPVDVIEDIAIAYGYNRIRPRWQRLPVTGSITRQAEFSNLVRETMIGLGYQEILTFTMTNPESLYDKMLVKPKKVVEIINPRMTTLTCMRGWLLPSLLEFLSHNTHFEYPQRIFEVGCVVVLDKKAETRTRDILKLACVSTHANANFSEIKSHLDALLLNLGVKNLKTYEQRHPSFIQGRTAEICNKQESIGVLGEVHPQVLNNWELKNPAAAFEINLGANF
jgi:phenylalanyl-tRNA synthetase beta chain